LDNLVIGLSLLNLIFTAIYGILNGFKFDKGLAYIVGFIYGVFIIISTAF